MEAGHDVFAAYECLRNDRAQKRFIQVLDLVRESIVAQAPAMRESGISPAVYLAAISSVTEHRLSAKSIDGLPELLRLLHIALGSAAIDSTVASRILRGVLPLFRSASTDLGVAICQVAAQLGGRVRLDEVAVEVLVAGLCANAQHDDLRLRKAASEAIYGFPQLHERCFRALFDTLDRNALRALTVIRNVASGVSNEIVSIGDQLLFAFNIIGVGAPSKILNRRY